MSNTVSKRARQRLKPLYITAFLQGMIFWYTVDKLLATSVGITTAQVGIILAIMSAVTIITEIPSGILADRWSRKGVLFISLVALLCSTAFGAVATAPWHYLGLSIFWGIYYAMYSGTYEAIVYDTLVEEEGDGRHFERMYGRVGRYEATGLVISSVIGGVFSSAFGIHVPFFATILFLIMALVFVLVLQEPRVHKMHDPTNFTSHLADTFRAVVSSRQLIGYFIVSMLLGAVLRTFWEYGQYWYIQLSLPIGLFGVINAGVLLMMWARSWAADRIKFDRNKFLTACLLFGVLTSTLLTTRNPYVAAIALISTMFWLLLAELVLSGLRQALLPSRLRAGAASVFSTVGHAVFIPVGILFGYLAKDGRVTSAVLLPMCILGVAVAVSSTTRRFVGPDVK